MRQLSLAFLAVLGLCISLPAAYAGSPAARHKPGPSFVRGTVASLNRSGFVLRTRHGLYGVVVIGATSVTEKGKRGRMSIQAGDDVGVRGFVQGRQIRAIYVHIYPRKARAQASTIEGTVTEVQGTAIGIRAGRRTVTVMVTPRTAVRFGNQVGRVSQVTVGVRVQVRVVQQGQDLEALRIHIYHTKASGKHVRVRGVLSAVLPGSISVRAGPRIIAVRITSATRVYLGNHRSSLTALRVGVQVTVYACCKGAILVATGIHVHKGVPGHLSTLLLHGWVLSLTPGGIRLSTPAGPVLVSLVAATRYTVGTAIVLLGSIRVGDEVSVRATRIRGGWQAVSVHVYQDSRRTHTQTGTIASISPGNLVLLDRGKRYIVSLQSRPAVSLSGHTVSAASLRPGDAVRVTGYITGPSSLTATRIIARRLLPKSQTMHGVVTRMSGTTLTIIDSTGAHRKIWITGKTAVLLHQRPAPHSLLFPGVHVTVRYIRGHGSSVAERITLTLTARTLTARVTAIGSDHLTVLRGTAERVRVDLPPGVAVMDGSKPVTVGIGAYVEAQGYAIGSGEMRAMSVHVVHLTVSLSGTAVVGSTSLGLDTAQGIRYRLRITPSTQLSTGRNTISLTASTIPNGVRLHVEGSVGADGRVTVTQMTIRLTSVTLRGTVTAIKPAALTLTTPTGPSNIRLGPAVTYHQGSRTLEVSGIVLGDDATVYGYDGGHGTVLARKILIHRRIIGVDGTVSSITGDGFVLTTADGQHPVVVTATTVFTGLSITTISIGEAVHVTGYARGDGSILATRVRAGKQRIRTPAYYPMTIGQ